MKEIRYTIDKWGIHVLYGNVVKRRNFRNEMVDFFRDICSLKETPLEKTKEHLNSKEKSILASDIRKSMIDDAKFEAMKDSSLKSDSLKWISETKAKSDDEIIADYINLLKENY